MAVADAAHNSEFCEAARVFEHPERYPAEAFIKSAPLFSARVFREIRRSLQAVLARRFLVDWGSAN